MTIFFADSAATGANDGSTALDAWETIAVITQASFNGGDTLVMSGTFTEQFTLADIPTTTSARRFTIESTATIDVTGLTLDYAFRINADFVTVDGGTYTGADDEVALDEDGKGIFVVTQEGLTIINTDCHTNASSGLHAVGCKNHIIRFNSVHDNGVVGTGGKGIVASAFSSGPNPDPGQQGGLVSDNICFNNIRHGIQVGGANGVKPSGQNICEDNECFDNGIGMRCEDSDFQIIRNNYLHDNLATTPGDGNFCLSLSSPDNTEIYGNTLIDAGPLDAVINIDPGGTCLNLKIYRNLIYSLTGGVLVSARVVAGMPAFEFRANLLIMEPSDTSSSLNFTGEKSGAPALICNNTFVSGEDQIMIDNAGGTCAATICNNIFYLWQTAGRAINEEANSNTATVINNTFHQPADVGTIIIVNSVTYTAATVTTLDPGAVLLDPAFEGPITGDVLLRNFTPTEPVTMGTGENFWFPDFPPEAFNNIPFRNPPSMGAIERVAGIPLPTLDTPLSDISTTLNSAVSNDQTSNFSGAIDFDIVFNYDTGFTPDGLVVTNGVISGNIDETQGSRAIHCELIATNAGGSTSGFFALFVPNI